LVLKDFCHNLELQVGAENEGIFKKASDSTLPQDPTKILKLPLSVLSKFYFSQL